MLARLLLAMLAPALVLRHSRARVRMIRNIDSMECLIIDAPMCADVARLSAEALDDGAGVAIADWRCGCEQLAAALREQGPAERVLTFGRACSFTRARQQLLVRPDGFGGSDGFGSKPRECERVPLPARCVVLTDERASCVEAMESGMRSVAVAQLGWSSAQVRFIDAAADVLLDELAGTCASDLSTPGAFWLNPPLPRAEDGAFLPDPDEHEAPCRRAATLGTATPAHALGSADGRAAAGARQPDIGTPSAESESDPAEAGAATSGDDTLFTDQVDALRLF